MEGWGGSSSLEVREIHHLSLSFPPWLISLLSDYTRNQLCRKRTFWAPPFSEVAEKQKRFLPNLDPWDSGAGPAFLFRPYLASTFSTLSSSPHSRLTVCQTISLLALNFCQEKKMKSALGELEGEKQLLLTKWERGGRPSIWIRVESLRSGRTRSSHM